MKETTGELNLTLIVAISVGILSVFFFTVLWPMIRGNFKREANCKQATCNCRKEIRDSNNGKCCCWDAKTTANPGTEITSCNGDKLFTCPFGG